MLFWQVPACPLRIPPNISTLLLLTSYIRASFTLEAKSSTLVWMWRWTSSWDSTLGKSFPHSALSSFIWNKQKTDIQSVFASLISRKGIVCLLLDYAGDMLECSKPRTNKFHCKPNFQPLGILCPKKDPPTHSLQQETISVPSFNNAMEPSNLNMATELRFKLLYNTRSCLINDLFLGQLYTKPHSLCNCK